MAKKKQKTAIKKNLKGQKPGVMNRRVLFRPDRYQYVRKLVPQGSCVFCDAAEADMTFENLCVYKTEYSMVMLNKFPYNSGHVLILPRHHKGSLLNLSEAEFSDLHLSVKKAMQAVQDVYQPAAMNVGLNHGKAAGAGIPDHLHYHLIPRWEGDLNFFPLIAETKVVIEALDQTYEKLKTYFKERA